MFYYGAGNVEYFLFMMLAWNKCSTEAYVLFFLSLCNTKLTCKNAQNFFIFKKTLFSIIYFPAQVKKSKIHYKSITFS